MSPPLFQIELDDRKLNFEPSSDLESSDFISYRLSSAARLLLLPRLCSEMSIDSRELITGAAGIADARLGRRPGMPRLAIEVMSSVDGSSAGGMQSLEYVFLRLLRAPRLNPHASQGKSCIYASCIGTSALYRGILKPSSFCRGFLCTVVVWAIADKPEYSVPTECRLQQKTLMIQLKGSPHPWPWPPTQKRFPFRELPLRHFH